MANFTGAQRSNYVRFKDDRLEEVVDYLNVFGIELSPHNNLVDHYCLLPGDTDDGLFCTSTYTPWPDDDDAEPMELDFEWVAKRLDEGQVLVIETVGFEKLRYLSGSADAWDWRGNWVGISIGEIYNRAAEAFSVDKNDITSATY